MSAALVLAAALAAANARAQQPAVPPVSAWEDAGFHDSRTYEIDAAPFYAGATEPARGTMPLYVLLVQDSGWTEALVRENLAAIAKVYRQCGLRFTRATVIETPAPARRVRFAKWTADAPESLRALVAASPLKARPVLYLFAGFTDADDDAAFSQADFLEGGADPVLYDSVFLPFGVNSQKYKDARAASPYTTSAHELWHVLTREGSHFNVAPPNIGNIWLTRSDVILTERDCPAILANPLVTRAAP